MLSTCGSLDANDLCVCVKIVHKFMFVVMINSDVDECLLLTAKCNQKCINGQGNYSCACATGYSLTNNQVTCAFTGGHII